MAGFFEEVGNFLFGDNSSSKMRKDFANKMFNTDNRQRDFNQFAGTALNSLANRGVVNSSVTGDAMSKALAQADQNFMNQQMQALSLLPEDTQGLIGGVGGAFASGLGQALPMLLML